MRKNKITCCDIFLKPKKKKTMGSHNINLNESLSKFYVSPLKSHRLQRRTQISMAQEKFERVTKSRKNLEALLVAR